MMYVHFCKICNRIHILNGHKMTCPKCTQPLTELQISYLEYISFSHDERNHFLAMCADQDSLHKISTTYRMYKYSKWYRNLQIINEDACEDKQNTC